ncbi:hypothetical protein CL656_05245, partial [bacterium]|nr:hypothetical protein [bacterium]
MNNIDSKYYTLNNTKNTKNTKNTHNKNLEKNKKTENKNSSYFDDMFVFLDIMNPFNSHIENFESDYCPKTIEELKKVITELKNSNKTLQEKNLILKKYIDNCSKGYNGVESLLNIEINDMLKNEIQRNIMIMEIENDFKILHDSLYKLLPYITPYMAIGAHPLDILNKKYSNENNGNFTKLYNDANKSYDYIKTNYGNLFNEKPESFIYGIRKVLDFIHFVKMDNNSKFILQYQPVIETQKPNVAMSSLGIKNIDVGDNNVFVDGVYGIKPVNTINNMANDFRKNLSKQLDELLECDTTGKMDIGGKNFTMYINVLINKCGVNEKNQNNFLKFSNGNTSYERVDENKELPYNNSYGLIHHMAALSYAIQIYTVQTEFANNIISKFRTLEAYSKSISKNSASTVTNFIKNYLKELDSIIDNAYTNPYINNYSLQTSQELKNLVSFREILEDSCYSSDYKQCCYYLKKLNENTGKYYLNCQSVEPIKDAENNMKYNNGVLSNNNISEGLSQKNNYLIKINLLYINYILCKMLRDSYCDNVLGGSKMIEADSRMDGLRDIIDEHSSYAAATSGRPKNSTMAISNYLTETFIPSREGYEGNSKIIVGETKFTDTVNNIIKNYKS